MVFYFISPKTEEVLSINPSANVFVVGDFNIHHKDWLSYSGGSDGPGELWYNFSILSDPSQMVNVPTWIPDCHSHSPGLLDLFLSSSASICSTMAFPPLGNSDHIVVLASIDFQSNSKWDAYCDYSCACWGVFVIISVMFHGKISLSLVLLLLLVNFMSGFRLELMYVSLI